MAPNGYVLALQQLHRLREDIREIFITGSDTESVLLFQFHNNEPIAFHYEQEDNNMLVTTTNNEEFVNYNDPFEAVQEALENILRGRRAHLHSLSINILSGITRLNLLRLIRAVDTALRSRVIHLSIEGATDILGLAILRVMLLYNDDTDGTITLSCPNELDVVARPRPLREQLNVRNLILKVRDIDDILAKLPHFISRNLECLNLKRRPTGNVPTQIDLRRVVELDQWRSVGKLVVDGFIITTPLQELQLENKTHVDIHLQSLSIQDVDYLKQRFIANPHHIVFRIGSEYRRNYIEEQWAMYERGAYFLIPHSDEVLRVSRDYRVYIFERIARRLVPNEVEEQLRRQQEQAD